MTSHSRALRWEVLMALLLLAILAEPLFGPSMPVNIISLALFEIVVVGALVKSIRGNRQRGFGLVLAIFWFGATLVALLTDGGHGLVAAFSGVLLVGALLVTFRNLLEREAGDYDALVGAIFGYVMLGMVWAMLFIQIERWQPGSIGFSDNADIWTSSIYYSLVTLTSLGYGDILPISSLARIVAGFEAVVGVLYIAVMIGSIVGTYQTAGREDSTNQDS